MRDRLILWCYLGKSALRMLIDDWKTRNTMVLDARDVGRIFWTVAPPAFLRHDVRDYLYLFGL